MSPVLTAYAVVSGATSPVSLLRGESTVREGVKKTNLKRSPSLLKVVRECCTYRSVKRGIYGLEV
eukprot:1352874-Rhodomonas_salina.1